MNDVEELRDGLAHAVARLPVALEQGDSQLSGTELLGRLNSSASDASIVEVTPDLHGAITVLGALWSGRDMLICPAGRRSDPGYAAALTWLRDCRKQTRPREPLIGLGSSGTGGEVNTVFFHSLASLTRSFGRLLNPALGANNHWYVGYSPAGIGGLLVLLRTLMNGDRVQLVRANEPRALLADLNAGPLRHVSVSPEMLRRLCQLAARRREVLRINAASVGGAYLPRPLWRTLETQLERNVVNSYGATEYGGPVATALSSEQAFRMLADVAVLTDGTKGEPAALRFSVSPSYDVAIGRNGTATPPDEAIYAGDFGWSADGDLWLSGRESDQVMIDEFSVSLPELMEIVETVPGVAACRPVVANGRLERIEVETEDELDSDTTLNDARAYLASFFGNKVGALDLSTTSALPRTYTGKVVRA